MKRLNLTILIAFVAFTTLVATARAPRASRGAIPFQQLVEMIATDAHWNTDNLEQIGLTRLVSECEQDEECGDFHYFVYGKNVKAKTAQEWSVTLTPAGRHAFAIEVTLMTDNCTKLYFKEKADLDAFMSCARRASCYSRDEHTESIGLSLIESDEYIDGWYVISFHGG